MTRRSSRRKSAALVPAALALAVVSVASPSCSHPSIPMPACGVYFDLQWVSDDELLFHLETCIWPEGAAVTVKNLRLQVWVGGLIQGGGTFTSGPLQAAEGDLLEVTVEVPEERIRRTCLLVGPATEPPIEYPDC